MNVSIILSDLFDISTTKSVDKNKVTFVDDGEYDFIGRQYDGWGIQGKIHKLKYEPNPAKTFSLVQVGNTVALYRERPWYASQNIFVLFPKYPQIIDTKLFIQAVLNKYLQAVYGTEYNSYPTLKSLNKIAISLPVIPSADPSHVYTPADINWQYMRDRITELERDRITELERDRIAELDAYLKAAGLDDYELTEEDKKVLSLSKKSASDEGGAMDGDCGIRKKEFRIGDLFKQLRGKEAAPNRVSDGNINMVNETSANNGITKKASSTHVFPANTITISVNYATTVFYQSEPYCASVNILILQNSHLNPENGAYIVALFRKNNVQYDYNHKISKDKLNDTMLSLPVTSSGEPDWDYMEKYIRAMEKVVIADVVKWKDKEIEATKKIVKETA